MADRLTALERLENTIEGEKVDRLPILVLTKMFGLKQLNAALTDCMGESTDLYVESQWHCVKELGHEALWAYSGLLEVNEIVDPTTVKVTEDNRFVARWYLDSIEGVRALPAVEVKDQGKVPWALEIIRRLRELSENRFPVFGHLSLPFENAYMLRGYDFFMDLIEAPDLVHRLLEYCLDLGLQYAQKMREAGADVIWATNPVVNSECISREHYETFGFPYDKKFFTTLGEKGIRTMFHACGDWSDRVDKVFDLGADIYYLSRQFDLLEAKKMCAPGGVVMGNVPAVATLLQGTPGDVEREALECVRKAAPGGRYILGADCTSPRDTPPENMAALFRVAKEME